MYAEDQPKIAAYARQSPKHFARVYKFVVATIQQPLHTVGKALRDFDEHGSASKFAFGHKATAIDFIDANAAEVWETADALSLAGPEALLSYLADLPGIGVVKGGFLAQLVWGEAGCLDMHNIERFGLDAKQFTAARFKNAKGAATRQKIIRNYLDLCADLGGVQGLWDTWCEFVAARDVINYHSADHVSRLHSEFICGRIAA